MMQDPYYAWSMVNNPQSHDDVMCMCSEITGKAFRLLDLTVPKRTKMRMRMRSLHPGSTWRKVGQPYPWVTLCCRIVVSPVSEEMLNG
jgi:hypothetical protein